jgi:LysM repeat protein
MRTKIILFLVVAAAIMAIGLYLVLSLLMGGDGEGDDTLTTGNGTNPSPAGIPLTIDNTTVFINPNPANAVTLQQQQPQPPVIPEVQPTAPLQPAQPTATTAPPAVQIQPTQPPSVAPVAPSGQGVVAGVEPIILIDYVVTADDTLYRITDKQTTSIELMAVYGIDAKDLTPGVTLRLPVGNPAYCSGSRPYVILPGDTAFSIANRLGTTAQRLQQLNNLNAEYRIDIADILCVP